VQWKRSDVRTGCVKNRSTVLSMLKSHENTEEDNQEGGVEDWRKLISNPMTIFFSFVNAEKHTTTMATISIQNIIKLSCSEK
jgi:hypothetical protein